MSCLPGFHFVVAGQQDDVTIIGRRLQEPIEASVWKDRKFGSGDKSQQLSDITFRVRVEVLDGRDLEALICANVERGDGWWTSAKKKAYFVV